MCLLVVLLVCMVYVLDILQDERRTGRTYHVKCRGAVQYRVEHIGRRRTHIKSHIIQRNNAFEIQTILIPPLSFLTVSDAVFPMCILISRPTQINQYAVALWVWSHDSVDHYWSSGPACGCVNLLSTCTERSTFFFQMVRFVPKWSKNFLCCVVRPGQVLLIKHTSLAEKKKHLTYHGNKCRCS